MGIFTTILSNELPFVLGLPNDTYTIQTSNEIVNLEVYGDYYKLIICPFPSIIGRQTIAYGTAKELEMRVYNSNINNYAFEKCWTYIKIAFTKEISESDYRNLDEQTCISHIESDLLRKGIQENHSEGAERLWNKYNETDQSNVKLSAYLHQMIAKFIKHELFYEAVNKLISHCAVYNNRIWLHQVNESILNGLDCTCYYNNQQFHYAKFIERGWCEPLMQLSFPAFSPENLIALNERLLNSEEIPFEVILAVA